MLNINFVPDDYMSKAANPEEQTWMYLVLFTVVAVAG